MQNKGNEVIIFTGNSLIIIEAKSKKVIREYHTGYVFLDEFKVGNFVGDDKLELYLSGIYEFGDMRNIYEVVDNTFVRSYDKDSFFAYEKGILGKIEKGMLKLNINIGNYTASETSILAERVFFDSIDHKNKNELLSITPEWTIVQENGTWS